MWPTPIPRAIPQEMPNWQENAPVQINGVCYWDRGDGDGATSVRDRVLEERLDQQQQLASASTTRLAALNSVQALFHAGFRLVKFHGGRYRQRYYAVLQFVFSLEANPTDNSLREAGAFDGVDAGRRFSNAAAA